MNIPNVLTAGDSASWEDPAMTVRGVSYDSNVFAMKYVLRGPKNLTIPSVANAGGWRTSLTVADSQTLAPGPYWWAAYLSTDSERVTAGGGQLVIAANLDAVSSDGFDGRTAAEIALANAKRALSDLMASGKPVKKYAIATRNAEYYTTSELIDAISYWERQVLNEKAEKAAANGQSSPRNHYVRFK